MKEIYIWHHLGLGDHFHCNALVRKFILKSPDKFKIIIDEQKDRNGFLICEHTI